MIQAVIFDMDGLMIDSEKLHSLAYETIIREYGKEPILHKNNLVQKNGLRSLENWNILKEKNDISEDVYILIEKRDAVFRSLLKTNVKPMPGLDQLLNLLKKHHIKMAIASSSRIETITIVLETLDIKMFFDTITADSDVMHGKPHPEIFLKTADNLKISPDDALVLEDAESGVIAAKAAGMKVIAVPNQYTKDQDFSLADIVVDSLKSVTIKLINSI